MRKIASRLSVAIVSVLLLTQCSTPAVQQDKRAPVLLAVFAHPDDESTVSMVLAKYAAAGVKVYLATATDGRLGVSQHAGIPAGDTLAAARVKELNCTTEKLGINPPIMFGLYDQLKMGEGLQPFMGQLSEMRARVTKLFEELQPDAVITWGPSGWTGHTDHRLVSDIVTEVFQSRKWQRPAQLYYPAVPTSRVPPNNPIPLAPVDDSFLTVRVPVSQADYDKSKAGFLCHASQYTPEQIEQLFQSLAAAQNGIAYFQPAIAGVGRKDSLLP
ncbi:MAG TPA: PIG-L deacetylase family protein [Steroidobacteraceae bacterium]|jgi:LmbE family N-acetylglucosaminyl deacetylase|nr:PIG-L deacetylase family protein [Steroidobacteraceae bacterium]